MDLMFLQNLINNSLTPLAKQMTISYIIAVVITGLVVVFSGLIILILFVWAFGKVFTKNKVQPQPQKTTVIPVIPNPQPTPNILNKNQEDDDEIIAVIAAAVAAMGASDGKTYKLKSVRAVKTNPSRSAWAFAGIQNDTNPF